MNLSDAQRLVMEVIEAHGGESYWNKLEAIDAEISASGFIFTAKHRPVLRHVHMRAYAHKPHFTFFNFPKRDQNSHLIGDEEVNIKDVDNHIVASRKNPRSAFRNLRQQLFWDSLDFIYFGGYATWNYLTAPFLFLRPGFTFEIMAPMPGEYESCSRLRVTFPSDIPTHSRMQIFYFDKDRCLRRLDYTAMVVGKWAHAAHLCEDYREFACIKAPTRRRVQPLMFGKNILPWPTLVALDIHNIQPIIRDTSRIS